MEPVMYNLHRFLEILSTDEELSDFFNRYDITFQYGDETIIDKVERYATHAYNQIKTETIRAGQATDQIDESPFFWCLKDAFYRLSKELYKSNE